jgi:signal transduction histidine kinase
LAREQYDLHELTEQVIGILKSLAKSKNLQLKNDLPKDIIIYQYYEPVKILIYNLLTNAINFSEQGTIRISGKKEKGNVLIEVEDQGVGMTPEQVQHLLGDQIVITATNIDNKKGHGLGFLIIKDLLKMTSGSMTIKSERGTGSKISIVLPANNYNQSESN